MNIYALQTARSGSKSIIHKNLLNLDNKPLYLYNIEYALNSKYIQDVYVSTDCPQIKMCSTLHKYNIIDRPIHLCDDLSSHHDTIKHGILSIETNIHDNIDIIVILLGNNRCAFTKDLDNAIQLLLEKPEIDSIQSVSAFNMFNPFRAFHIIDNRLVNIISDTDYNRYTKNISNCNEKNAFGDVYFFNGSFWICRRRAIFMESGSPPYPWLGKNIQPYIQPACFELDAEWQLKLI